MPRARAPRGRDGASSGAAAADRRDGPGHPGHRRNRRDHHQDHRPVNRDRVLRRACSDRPVLHRGRRSRHREDRHILHRLRVHRVRRQVHRHPVRRLYAVHRDGSRIRREARPPAASALVALGAAELPCPIATRDDRAAAVAGVRRAPDVRAGPGARHPVFAAGLQAASRPRRPRVAIRAVSGPASAEVRARPAAAPWTARLDGRCGPAQAWARARPVRVRRVPVRPARRRRERAPAGLVRARARERPRASDPSSPRGGARDRLRARRCSTSGSSRRS